MARLRPNITRGLLAAGAATSLALFTATTAQAHAGSVDLTRGSCAYTGYSEHHYAYTQKLSGSCSGHAWLRVTMRPTAGGAARTSSWIHDARKADAPTPSGYTFTKTEHKSCETCQVKTITH
ncbi:hypothetical protein QF035_002214 [Streptomyces umbrinus]|uniref:Uncharacterized protein n=1 Tax=Streptomyces umbrinus TaxID=67370 RepID=A0ABU0SM40_9ACTN|nr:hypothetical protein [Streptomyces umbrinus]